MNETVNQENMTNQNAGTEEQSRTFTQAELDAKQGAKNGGCYNRKLVL